MWLPESPLPPLVEWSFPPPPTFTPYTFHFAGQSAFQYNLALPPNGDTRPLQLQPFVYSTLFSRQSTATVSPSKSVASVVVILPHCGQITETGNQPSGRSAPDTSFCMRRIASAPSSASRIMPSILPDRY